MTYASQNLLNPENCVFIFIDHQPQMAFGVRSIDAQLLKNNTVALAKTAKTFNAPSILTSVESEAFSGYIWPELMDVLKTDPYERTTMNPFEDQGFMNALQATGRKKLIISGLWTGTCIALPTLCALDDGYEVYVAGDTCGETSPDAQYAAMTRMEQAGARPVTSLQVLLELQRDWARKETYNETLNIIRDHYGTYGMGVDYADTIVHRQKQRAEFPQIVEGITSRAAE